MRRGSVRPPLQPLLDGAREALGVMGAVLLFGLVWAAVEGRAVGAYPGAEMARSPEDTAHTALPEAAVWLLDGYNVLHAGLLPPGPRRDWWTGEHRQRVLAAAARFLASRPGAQVWVVFDGPSPAEEPLQGGTAGVGVRSVFAPSADDWLLQRLREGGPGEVALVTADRRLAGRARHRGARVVAPRSFLAACG
jgi:hypothetical protein